MHFMLQYEEDKRGVGPFRKGRGYSQVDYGNPCGAQELIRFGLSVDSTIRSRFIMHPDALWGFFFFLFVPDDSKAF